MKASSIPCSLFILSILACGSPPQDPPPEPTSPENPLFVSPADFDFSQNPRLLERLQENPHRYFRFTNVPFSVEVCRRYAEEIAAAPTLNLHGDAHVEQYAVTDLGRGMTDFDDSSLGPAHIDLLRFGASLLLACEQEGCVEDFSQLYGKFLQGYRLALENPQARIPEPVLVRRKKEAFDFDPEGYYSFVESSMEPVPEEETAAVVEALTPYFEAMVADHPELPPDFFQVQRLGYLRLGVGSALDLKFLVRVRGLTEDPFDDAVLEVKQVRDISGIPCIISDTSGDPLRVLRGHLRIAHQPFEYLGYARYRDRNFWAHAWVKNYSEIEIDEDFGSSEELAEVAFDVGWQFGLGHMKNLAEGLDRQLRRQQIEFVDAQAAALEQGSREMAVLAREAWEQFRDASTTP